MRHLNLLASLLCLLPLAAGGQGYVWTWHGDSGLFQGTFQVSEAEMQLGSFFNSTLFTNSIAITSPDGLTYVATNYPGPYVGGSYGPPLRLGITLIDQATLSRIEADVVPNQGSSIHEDSPLPNGQHGESGFWSYAYVPEPASSSLLVLGACIVAVLKRTRCLPSHGSHRWFRISSAANPNAR
jgi:hypothetical protein